MTHIIALAEGFPDGIDAMMEDIRAGCVYKLKNGASYEIGNNAQPSIREIRLYDIIVKEDFKDKFLSDLKRFAYLSYGKERVRRPEGKSYKNTKPYLKHGIKLGPFRGLMKLALRLVGAKPINMKSVKVSDDKDNRLLKYINKRKKNGTHVPWHGYIIPFGQLSDPIVKDGRNKGRENS